MKNSVFALRTTTAILVSLSLASTQAVAAGSSAVSMQVAQNTAAQADQSGGSQNAQAQLRARVDAALKALDNDNVQRAQKALARATSDVASLEKSGASSPALNKLAESLNAASTALENGDADGARTALDAAEAVLAQADGVVVAQAATADAKQEDAKQEKGQAKKDKGEAKKDRTKKADDKNQAQDAAASEAAQSTEAKSEKQPAAKAEAQPTANAEAQPTAKAEAQPAAKTPDQATSETTAEQPTATSTDTTQSQQTEAPAPKVQETEAQAPKKRESGETKGTKRQDSSEAQVTKNRDKGDASATSTEKATTTSQTEQSAPADTTKAAEAPDTKKNAKAADAATAEQPTTEQSVAKDATTVQQVNKQDIKEATSAGKDVVVKDETSADDLQAQIQALQQKQADLETQLNDAKAVSSDKEVVTDANSRSATEEVQVRNNDNDNNSNTWKYLGAAAAGAVVGALVPALGGRLVQDQGDRMIVERGGEFFVRKDENQLLRQPGATIQTEEFNGGITRTTVTREDGSQIVTLRNDGGFILRRTRVTPDGREIVLLEQTPQDVYSFSDWGNDIPENAHRAESIEYGIADREQLQQALVSQSSYEPTRVFPLQAVRDNVRVREQVPAVDLPITFDSGSAAIPRSEVDDLTQLGRMMSDAIDNNPREIFLVEGHTDAVGSNLMNLALSDRRAEAVALALTEYFDIPPENLIVQGYGERFLKEQTDGASAINRRATVRRITPLIDRVASR